MKCRGFVASIFLVIFFSCNKERLAEFSVVPATATVGQQVQVVPDNYRPRFAYEWDFGDGHSTMSIMSDGSAAHAYSKPGIYFVTLKLMNQKRTRTVETQTKSIEIDP